MTFKKVLSVFLAVLMLVSVMSVGLAGIAADIDYNTQYDALAEAMKNEHVRDLTNYTITNKTPENETEGFDTEANGFAYEHKVTAQDNAHGDILRAANIFYYIAEHIISTTPEVGISNAGLLVETVTKNLKSRFNDGDDEYYEDFYGARYYPTEEEKAKYQEVVDNLALVDREVTQASLTSFNIYFMKKDYYEYYNVDTIIKYFAGNALKINAGNWYHKYLFEVETSVDTCLKDSEGINNLPDTKFAVRKAVYEWQYERSFNDTQTKAFYAFKQPSLDDVCEYLSEDPATVSDLSRGEEPLTATGQASAFYIKSEDDTTTLPILQSIYGMFVPYIFAGLDNGKAWDARFAAMNETQLATAIPNASEIVESFDWLTENYSNDALIALFGRELGNMVTLTYILKPISQSPERTVRGSAKYVATADKLNDIVRDMDALVYSDSADNPTAQKVGTIVKQFFNTSNSLFEGTDVEGMDFVDLNELVHHLVTGLLFRDSIVNMLVELIYPMIVDLLEEKLYDAIRDAVGDTITGWANDIIDDVIERNDLAIYPNTLADRINEDYPNKFNSAIAVLRAAGSKWENVNYDALDWGVDSASYSEKAELFIDALCAGLGGFMRAVVTVMCGDAEYTENAGWSYDEDQYNEYLDKFLLSLGIAKGYLRSQGGYTKLIVPLFRVLGIPEMASGAKYNTTITGYVTPADYHAIIMSKDGAGKYRYNYSLRLILAPIIYWVENILAQRPFETIWDLIPNLVYFFTRHGTSPTPLDTIRSNCTDDEVVDRTHGGIQNGVPQYEQLQSYNLLDILDSIYILIDIDVFILVVWKNFTVNVGSLGDLIDKDELLGSVNGLLAELLSMEYVVGEGELQTVAYANSEGIAVMPDSFEYATNSAAYPTPLLYVYANENETEYRAAPDDIHNKEITNPEKLKSPYQIPQLQEAKLTSVTTLKSDGTLNDPNAIGILNTAWNTIDVRNPGVVLMYVLRFVLSALGYKYDISDTTSDPNLPMLIECFGLNIDNELFQGLNLKDIIYNVMLHPDEAICALLELFYSNEDGNLYEGERYTYPISNINYHENVLLNKTHNPSLLYGTPVKYTKYWTREYARDTIANAEELAKNVLMMLGTEGFEEGIGPYLKNMLDGLAFNDDLINTLFNTIYQLLGGLNGQVGFDIEAILDAALDVSFKPQQIGATLEKMLGYSTQASIAIKNASSWNDLFTAGVETDPVTGEETPIISDVKYDWGIADAESHGLTTHDAFLKVASALLSPAAFVFRFLFLDEHLNLLNLIEIDGYAGYQYAFIGLLEMLSCPNILSYREYYEKSSVSKNNKTTGEMMGDANTIYYLLSPVLSLLDKVYADPISTVLDLIPNLLFFISIGGLNDLLNNLVHFAYVLLDILKPIVNGYDLLNGLISNINISGLVLNLSLPLDIDFNALISDLLDSLVGDSLTIEGVKITLPYIDFHTLCCGTLIEDESKNYSFISKEGRNTIHLFSAGGGDLLTALLRLVFEALFMEENKEALGQIIINAVGSSSEAIDDYDVKTAKELIDTLFDLMEEYEIPDILLFAVYFIVNKATPISGTLAGALKASGMTITELFSDISDPAAFIKTVIGLFAGEQEDYHNGEPDDDDSYVRDGKAAMSIWERIKAFFQKIGDFFRRLFGKA